MEVIRHKEHEKSNRLVKISKFSLLPQHNNPLSQILFDEKEKHLTLYQKKYEI